MNIDENDLHAKFFEAYGRAVLSWQYVEHEMFLLFSALIRAPDPATASGAYHAVVNFRTRLSMINAAAQAALKALHPGLWDDWIGAKAILSAYSGKRNDLAHMTLLGVTKNDEISLRLGPGIFIDTGGDPKSYALEDIEDVSREFIDFAKFLDELGQRISEALPRPSK